MGGHTMVKDRSEGRLLRPEAISGLLEGRDDLSDQERALLVALIEVETETGRPLSDAERAAVEALRESVQGFDVEKVSQAVRRIVTAESREDRETDWPDLEKRFEGL